MKKCLFIILIFIFASGAYAQQIKLNGGITISSYSQRWPSEFYWAENAGLSRSPFMNDKTRFLGGVGIEFALNDKISVEIDGMYFQRGSAFTFYTTVYEIITEAYYMNGISFPLLIKARFFPPLYPYFIGGSEFSFILSHSRTTTVTGEFEGIRVSSEDILEYTKKFDFGLVLGIGFEMKVSKVSCFLEGRLNFGQRNLFTSNEFYPSPPEIKTSALQIIAGFKI